MEIARLDIRMARNGMNTNGALALTDDKLFQLVYDAQEFERMQQAEQKLADMLKTMGKFADAVNSIVGSALTRTKEFTEATQRGVPLAQVELDYANGRMQCVIMHDGQPFDMKANEWQFDKSAAEKFVARFKELKTQASESPKAL